MKTIQEIGNATKLLAYINSFNKPELAEQEGMVCQLWEDGEVTLQKSGNLLWMRSLHSIYSGLVAQNLLTGTEAPTQLAIKDVGSDPENPHSYIFVESTDIACHLRLLMAQFAVVLAQIPCKTEHVITT